MRPGNTVSAALVSIGCLALAGCQGVGTAARTLAQCPTPRPVIAASPAPKEKSEREPARLCWTPA